MAPAKNPSTPYFFRLWHTGRDKPYYELMKVWVENLKDECGGVAPAVAQVFRELVDYQMGTSLSKDEEVEAVGLTDVIRQLVVDETRQALRALLDSPEYMDRLQVMQARRVPSFDGEFDDNDLDALLEDLTGGQ
jgi:hypothetical protein